MRKPISPSACRRLLIVLFRGPVGHVSNIICKLTVVRRPSTSVDALRHPYPVKQEMGAILLRENTPSASDVVAVMREPLNLSNVQNGNLLTALMYACVFFTLRSLTVDAPSHTNTHIS